MLHRNQELCVSYAGVLITLGGVAAPRQETRHLGKVSNLRAGTLKIQGESGESYSFKK